MFLNNEIKFGELTPIVNFLVAEDRKKIIKSPKQVAKHLLDSYGWVNQPEIASILRKNPDFNHYLQAYLKLSQKIMNLFAECINSYLPKLTEIPLDTRRISLIKRYLELSPIPIIYGEALGLPLAPMRKKYKDSLGMAKWMDDCKKQELELITKLYTMLKGQFSPCSRQELQEIEKLVYRRVGCRGHTWAILIKEWRQTTKNTEQIYDLFLENLKSISDPKMQIVQGGSIALKTEETFSYFIAKKTLTTLFDQQFLSTSSEILQSFIEKYDPIFLLNEESRQALFFFSDHCLELYRIETNFNLIFEAARDKKFIALGKCLKNAYAFGQKIFKNPESHPIFHFAFSLLLWLHLKFLHLHEPIWEKGLDGVEGLKLLNTFHQLTNEQLLVCYSTLTDEYERSQPIKSDEKIEDFFSKYNHDAFSTLSLTLSYILRLFSVKKSTA